MNKEKRDIIENACLKIKELKGLSLNEIGLVDNLIYEGFINNFRRFYKWVFW